MFVQGISKFINTNFDGGVIHCRKMVYRKQEPQSFRSIKKTERHSVVQTRNILFLTLNKMQHLTAEV